MAKTSSGTVRLRLVGARELPHRAGDAKGPSDEALVARAKRRELSAFETLYRRHAPFALNLAVHIQGTTADVEDIVHDAFVRAHERLPELRDTSAFRSWLGSIVVRLVRTRLRRRRLLAVLGLAGHEPVDLEAVAAPEADPETRASLAQVYALLQTMPADDRIAWTLRHVERHGLDSVAALTGCSLATAKRRISRAQSYLSQKFVAPFAEVP
jgi:RNA polymerase sigma-70 factor (ECF subfamily)